MNIKHLTTRQSPGKASSRVNIHQHLISDLSLSRFKPHRTPRGGWGGIGGRKTGSSLLCCPLRALRPPCAARLGRGEANERWHQILT
eukprot:CAMPEP_0198243584 /NCGR_PEP_ID=MMETSP1446-20131203/29107_1 /TAXON_ID=1461542 ORGANISM="Unidentified sp, Strain CCMP2111" /NCGR_SAMPLE_ID=MMETSP1446 /ASSEMBLY_ACC=CAM_ASM_001112 /LENGTH=86 /DNA_ID=CAMNT_0043927449 /DNA_START=317 /DNA_END=578 /DNA_ORIENTATION=+